MSLPGLRTLPTFNPKTNKRFKNDNFIRSKHLLQQMHSGSVFFRQMSRLMTKPTKWHVRPAKTQIRLGGCLGIRPVSSESSLSAWRKLGSLATHWAHSEDSDQTGRIPRLIWVFAGRKCNLLVLSWGGSNGKFRCSKLNFAPKLLNET